MKTVYSEKELRLAIEAGEPKIIIKGGLAKRLTKRYKAKRIGRGGLAGCAVAAAAALPLTGGASLPVLGATLAGLTVGTVTISVVELVIICGLLLGAIALQKGYKKVKFNPDGSIEVEKE